MADTATPDISSTADIFEHLSNIPDDSSPKGKESEPEGEEEELDLNLPESEPDEEEDEEQEEEPTGKIDLEDEDEKEENELELAKIPSAKKLKEKYPNIFKDFPAVEKIFYRERAYAETFPTVKDAKAAREALNEYQTIQTDLLNGDISGVLAQVKNTDPKAFNKIAANVLDALGKVDNTAIVEPSRAILKGTIFNLNKLAEAALRKDPNNKRAEQLQIATELIHEAIFNTSEVSAYARSGAEEEKENPEKAAIARERAELDNRKFSEAHGKVTFRFNDLLTRAIDKNVDPRNVLSAYVRSKLSDDIKSELDRQLIADKRFEGIVKKLYERARSENYSQQSLDNILTALKNKAASILPEIIRAKKGEALRGSKPRQKTRELSREKEEQSEDATTRNSGKLTRSAQRNKEEDGPQPGESIHDYLNRKLGD